VRLFRRICVLLLLVSLAVPVRAVVDAAPAGAVTDCLGVFGQDITFLGTWVETSGSNPLVSGSAEVDASFEDDSLNSKYFFTPTLDWATGGGAPLLDGVSPTQLSEYNCGGNFDIGSPELDGFEVTGAFSPGLAEATGTWSADTTAGTLSGTFDVGRVTTAVSGSGTTLSTGSGATPSQPLQTTVTSPTSGSLDLSESTVSNPGSFSGFQLLNEFVKIDAPSATASSPLQFTFELDASVLGGATAQSLEVFRNGGIVPNCAGAPGVASPDPCVSSRVMLPDGNVQVTVLSSGASVWNFGQGPPGFAVTTSSLPSATRGVPYSVQLQAVNGTSPYKWKKISKLPKGLKLSSTGLISGTISAATTKAGLPKVAPGTYPISVSVKDHNKHPSHTATASFELTVN
jgi:hypothetical protein